MNCSGLRKCTQARLKPSPFVADKRRKMPMKPNKTKENPFREAHYITPLV